MAVWDLYLSHLLQDYELFFRVTFSAIFGFFIGLDRTQRNKPAGVKTYTFVTAACALITIISIESVVPYSGLHETVRMDPMRLTAQIVTGLGFIGAGLILKTGERIVGLTSAAMLFFAGGIGIGIGAGFYTIVLFAFIVTFAVVPFGNWIESKEERKAIKARRVRKKIAKKESELNEIIGG